MALPTTQGLYVDAGINDGAQILDANKVGFPLTNAFTFECFILPSNISAGSNKVIAGEWFFPANFGWLFHITSVGRLGLFYSADGTNAFFDEGQAVAISTLTNTWFHVGVAFDLTDMQFYLNGAVWGPAQTTQIGSNLFNSAAPLIYGNDGNIGIPLLGTIALPRLWNVKKDATYFTDNWDELVITGTGLLHAPEFGGDLSDSGPTGQPNMSFVDTGLLVDFPPIDSGGGGGTPGGNTPAISNVSPASGIDLDEDFSTARQTPVQFDVTVSGGDLSLSVITLKYANSSITRVVHNGSHFVDEFSSLNSSRVPITGGYRYVILPGGGWRSSISEMAILAASDTGVSIL